MMRPKKTKEPKVKLTKDSWRKAARFLRYLKPYAGTYFSMSLLLILLEGLQRAAVGMLV